MPKPAYLTPEVEEFRRTFRAFVESEVTPQIPAWEKAGAPSREFWRALGRHGFLCPWLSEQDGGPAAPFGFSVVICEELGRTGAMGLQTAVSVHSDITAPYIADLAEGALRARWLTGAASGDIVTAIAMTEPGAGSDLAAVRTSAVRDGDHFVLNGQKTFITNGISCDLVIVVAKTDAKAKHSGISLIVVEEGTPGFVKARKLEKMGQHAGDTGELFFEDCRVPVGNLLGAEGQGFRYLMQNLQRERLMIGIAAQTAAEQMLAKAIAYSRDREAFGQKIASFQHNAFKIVERATEVEIGRTFLDALIDEFEAGTDITRRVSMAKWWLSDMANRVAYDAVQLHGGYGYMAEYPIARDYVDVRAMPIYAGSNEVMKLIIARMMGLMD